MDNKQHNFDELIKKALAETDPFPATFDVNTPPATDNHWNLFEQKLNNEQENTQHFDQVCKNALEQISAPKYNPKHWQLLEKELSTPNNLGAAARFDQVARTALQQGASKQYNPTHWVQMERLLNQKYYTNLLKKIGATCIAAALLFYFYNNYNQLNTNILPSKNTPPIANNQANSAPANTPTLPQTITPKNIISTPNPAELPPYSANNNNTAIKSHKSQANITAEPFINKTPTTSLLIPTNNIQENNNFSLVKTALLPLSQVGQANKNTNLLNITAQKQLPSFLLTENNTQQQTTTAQNYTNNSTLPTPPPEATQQQPLTTPNNSSNSIQNNLVTPTNTPAEQQKQSLLPSAQANLSTTNTANDLHNTPTTTHHTTKSIPKFPYSLALIVKAGIYVGSDFSKAQNTHTNGLRLGIANGVKANISTPRLKKWSIDAGIGYAYQTVSYQKTDNIVQSKKIENNILIDTINVFVDNPNYQIDILSANSLYAASFSRFEIPLTVQFHFLNTKKVSLYAGAGLNTHLTLKKQYTQSQIGYINTIFRNYDTAIPNEQLQNLITADATPNTPNPYNGTMPLTSDNQKPQIAYKRLVNNSKSETKLEPKELILNAGSIFKIDKKWNLDVRANIKNSITPYSFVESPYYQYKTQTQKNIISYGWQLGILYNF